MRQRRGPEARDHQRGVERQQRLVLRPFRLQHQQRRRDGCGPGVGVLDVDRRGDVPPHLGGQDQVRDQVAHAPSGRHGERTRQLRARAAAVAHHDRIDALRDAGQVERRRQLRERVHGHRGGGDRRAGHGHQRHRGRAVESRSGQGQRGRGGALGRLRRGQRAQLDRRPDGLEGEAAGRGDRGGVHQDVPRPRRRRGDEQLRAGAAPPEVVAS